MSHKRIFTIITVLLFSSLVYLSSNCDSGGGDDANLASIIGTWVNADYNDRGIGAKHVFVQNDDGSITWAVYDCVECTVPFITDTIDIITTWIYSEGTTYYYLIFEYPQDTDYSIVRTTYDGNVMEITPYKSDFPSNIDPLGQYAFYIRLGYQPTNLPDPPVITTPSDMATVNTTEPDLQWTGGDGAYYIDIRGPGDLYRGTVSSNTCTVGTDITPAFDDGETLWWKVKGYKDGLWSDWSETVRVHVDTGVITNKGPTLISPQDGAIITTPTPMLQWSDIGTHYELYIRGPSDIYRETVYSATCQIGVDITPQLDSWDGTLYWEVRAYIDSEWSTWSEARKFSVNF